MPSSPIEPHRHSAWPSPRNTSPTTGVGEVLLLWAVFAVVAVEILVTYSRVPVAELFGVRTGGLGEGISRVLAFVGFPVGLFAIASLAIVGGLLSRRLVALAAIATAAIAVAVFWPGAVDEAGLEVGSARVFASVGVVVAVGLTLQAARAAGLGGFAVRQRGDRVRLGIAGVLLFAALPWMAADLGLSLDRVPVLRSIFQTDLLTRQPDRSGLHPSVDDGHHHGMDGVLLALGAIALSRALPAVGRRLRQALTVYLSFLFVYGVANALQDFWLEQVVKRGWTRWEFPSMLVPSASIGWIVIPALSVVLAILVVRLSSRTHGDATRAGESA